jgi:AbiEi antitoxin C-terminal domain
LKVRDAALKDADTMGPLIIRSNVNSTEEAVAAAIHIAEIGGTRNFRISELAASLPAVAPRALQSALRRQISVGRLIRPSPVLDHVFIVPREYQIANVVPVELWLDYFLTKVLEIPYYVGYLSAARIHGVYVDRLEITQVALEQRRRDLNMRAGRIVFYQRYNKAAPVRWHETSNGRIRISTPETTCFDLLKSSSPDRRQRHLDQIILELVNMGTADGTRDALIAFNDLQSAARLQLIAIAAGKSEIAAAIKEWRNSVDVNS